MLQTLDHDGGIRELRLARPPVNALDLALLTRLTEAVASAKEANALVITGQPGLFSAGLDVRSLLALDRDAITSVFTALWRAQHALAHAPMPVIFGITGHCPAGGTVLAIHADYRVMAQGEFRMGLNEVQVGLFPGGVIEGAFRRLTGGHAAQLLTRGALVDPATALRVGLVDELCDADQVVTRALDVAREYCALPRDAMLRTRTLVRRDLCGLFGKPEDAAVIEKQFAAMGTEMWFSAATRDLLRKMFTKR